MHNRRGSKAAQARGGGWLALAMASRFKLFGVLFIASICLVGTLGIFAYHAFADFEGA